MIRRDLFKGLRKDSRQLTEGGSELYRRTKETVTMKEGYVSPLFFYGYLTKLGEILEEHDKSTLVSYYHRLSGFTPEITRVVTSLPLGEIEELVQGFIDNTHSRISKSKEEGLLLEMHDEGNMDVVYCLVNDVEESKIQQYYNKDIAVLRILKKEIDLATSS